MAHAFRTRSTYLTGTQISSLLDSDPIFIANMSALVGSRPNPSTFALHRSWLVRSALSRYSRQSREMAVARDGASAIERELIAA